jgi:hypothetical protein
MAKAANDVVTSTPAVAATMAAGATRPRASMPHFSFHRQLCFCFFLTNFFFFSREQL